MQTGPSGTKVGTTAKLLPVPQILSRKKNVEAEGPIFQCITMLAAAVGPALTKWLHDILELMFNCGLSEPLREALVAIATNIPPFLKLIQG
jgi:FKBP12-rapamycin complex-associated protein